MGTTIWLHAAGEWHGILLAQRRNTPNKLLQVLHRDIFGKAVDIFLTSIHPHRVFASLQRLHPNPKEIGGDLDTQQFLASGILQLMDTLHQRFCRHFLFFGGLCILGLAAKDFCAAVKGGDVIFQQVGALLADV
jgi:hypothetical protein